jgi:hypothetical protein
VNLYTTKSTYAKQQKHLSLLVQLSGALLKFHDLEAEFR